jgi:hypothetical protein
MLTIHSVSDDGQNVSRAEEALFKIENVVIGKEDLNINKTTLNG